MGTGSKLIQYYDFVRDWTIGKIVEVDDYEKFLLVVCRVSMKLVQLPSGKESGASVELFGIY